MAKRRQSSSPARLGIKQVAEAAGVSTATVSRVLSAKGYASAQTRAHVMSVVERLGYRPDAMAQGLRSQRGTTLGVLVPELTNPVTLSFIRGVQHVAQDHEYAVMIGDAQRDADIERRQIELFGRQRVAAVIVAGPLQDGRNLALLETGPALMVQTPANPREFEDLERRAIADAMSDLAEKGHRRVAFVSRAASAPEGAPTALVESRRRAVNAAADVRGLTVEKCTIPKGFRAAETMERLEPAVAGATALICASHRLAPQLLSALAALNVDIPGDISFLTFGDSEWAQAYRPALAVIRLDRYQEARSITREILVQLGRSPKGEGPPSEPTYEPRGSVAACPAPSVPRLGS